MDPKLFNLKQARKRIRVQILANAFGTAIFLYILEMLREMNPLRSREIVALMAVGFLLQVTVIGRLWGKVLSLNREMKQL